MTELTQKGFIDWCRNGSGYERKHLYDDKKLNEAVQVGGLKNIAYANGLHVASMMRLALSSIMEAERPIHRHSSLKYVGVAVLACPVALFVGRLSRIVPAEALSV